MIYDHHLSKQASTIGPRTQMPVCSLCLKSELRLDIAAAVIRQVKKEARIHAVLLGLGQVLPGITQDFVGGEWRLDMSSCAPFPLRKC